MLLRRGWEAVELGEVEGAVAVCDVAEGTAGADGGEC